MAGQQIAPLRGRAWVAGFRRDAVKRKVRLGIAVQRGPCGAGRVIPAQPQSNTAEIAPRVRVIWCQLQGVRKPGERRGEIFQGHGRPAQFEPRLGVVGRGLDGAVQQTGRRLHPTQFHQDLAVIVKQRGMCIRARRFRCQHRVGLSPIAACQRAL